MKMKYRHMTWRQMEKQQQAVIVSMGCSMLNAGIILLSWQSNKLWNITHDMNMFSAAFTFGMGIVEYLCSKMHSKKLINQWADEALHAALVKAEAQKIADGDY